MKLGVNIDHTATLREARKTSYPDPVVAALLAEYGGADSIVAHLREDRRHIKERDILLIKETVTIPFNMEMSTYKDIVSFAVNLKPNKATLVPERRKELTTEGGLDLTVHFEKVKKAVEKLKKAGIEVSLFIDPVKGQIDRVQKLGVDAIELHTGKYVNSKSPGVKKKEIERLQKAAYYAHSRGLFVAAGHGLEYENVKSIARIRAIKEFNIGHAIIAHAIFVGLVAAVEEMKQLISKSG